MIPLSKLLKLPRSQKLRKAAKLAGEAERRFVVSGRLSAEEAEYLAGLMETLASDFSAAALETLKAAQACIAANGGASSDEEADENSYREAIRRALNGVHHLLLAETGHCESDWDFIESRGVLDPSKRRPFPGMQAYFEDIRSPYNVGAMFRAAESFGAERVWLSPLCADPRHKRAQRTAMGCVDVLPWERLPLDPFAAQKETHAPAPPFDAPCFALETGGIPLERFPFPSRGIMIAGSEELGVSPRALAAADASLGRVTIPTRGAKGSLNVSVAFGIVMQAWAAAYSHA